MDVNGQRFWLLADAGDWPVAGRSGAEYRADRRTLRLASQRPQPTLLTAEPEAEAALEQVPAARDGFGTRAVWVAARSCVLALGDAPRAAAGAAEEEDDPDAEPDGPVLLEVTDGVAPTDLAVGPDGVLYIVFPDAIELRDLRGRWPAVRVSHPELRPWRIAATAEGGAWVLDRDNGRVGRLRGLPLRQRPARPLAPGRFDPEQPEPDPPRLERLPDPVWDAGERPVAIAASPAGRVAVLSWAGAADARVRLLDAGRRLGPPTALTGLQHPFSLAWLDDERVAVLLPRITEAPTYRPAETGGAALPTGEFHPLRDWDGGPFLHGIAPPPHYPAAGSSLPLQRLSLPWFAPIGRAVARPLDGGADGMAWHRLYLEAVIPPGCGVALALGATDEPGAEPDAWFDHVFGGTVPADGVTPRGTWLDASSELPFHPGLLDCPRVPGSAGLFTALIQRAGRRVRTLRGRYLHVRATLSGAAATTPEIAAVRAWGARFSYRDRYLPELYTETAVGAESDDVAPATPPDFLERFLAIFEGVLSPLEDRIARADLLTRAETVPEAALEWLGGWIGFGFDPHFPAERRRDLLRVAPELHRWRGTLRGLSLALDTVTGGAVRIGGIVILEDFRLRRTFATILGADLADEEDPLTGNFAISGNSYVGDTLFLGRETQREFMALFAAELERSEADERAVEQLFDRAAHRLTVLVRSDLEDLDPALVRRVVELEAPAHLDTRVLAASRPLLVGLSSLVGVDTWLARRSLPRTVRVGRSRVGVADFVQRPPGLDPRLEGDPS